MASDTFDPLDWLQRFKAVGGWYVAQDEEVHAGWKLLGNPNDEAARATWREIEHSEDRRSAVRAAIDSPI